MAREINMFVIYAREDKKTKLSLLRHLNPFKESFNLSIWHDDQIDPGQQWKPHIESRLNHTDIFLLLVSVDFMNSQFIKQIEFKAAIDRHRENKSVVIPIIIDYCQWDIDFKLIDYEFNLNELQVLPQEGKPIGDWNTPDQAYNNVAAGVRKVLTSISNNHIQLESKEEIEKKKEAAVKRKDEEEKRLKEETEARRKDEEEKRLKEETEAKRKDEEEKRLKEETEAKRKAEEEKRLKEEAAVIRKDWEVQLIKKKKLNKILLVGFLIIAVVLVGVFVFPIFNTKPETLPGPSPKSNPTVLNDSIDSARIIRDSLNKEELFSKLRVGDTYEGGIIFKIDHSSKTGKMAYHEDAGPMPWNKAMNIKANLGEEWRLPTFDELRQMYDGIGQGSNNIGQFTDELYWSSTSYNNNEARLLRFRDGNLSYHYSKDFVNRKYRVRAIRDFRH